MMAFNFFPLVFTSSVFIKIFTCAMFDFFTILRHSANLCFKKSLFYTMTISEIMFSIYSTIQYIKCSFNNSNMYLLMCMNRYR